jgi:hypothetical protein
MTYRLPTLISLATLAIAAPAAHAASPTIAQEAKAVTVSAQGDAIAYSNYANGRYQLMIGDAAAKVPTSAHAFDVDLGTDAAGKTVAVYSLNGKVHEYDVAAATDKTLSYKGTQPTIADGKVAYVRGGTLYLGSKKVYSAPAIKDPELSGSHLAFVTVTNKDYVQTLRVQTLTGKSKGIYEARSGGANDASIVSPTFDASGKHLYFARRNMGSGQGNRYIRRTLSTGKTGYALGTLDVYSLSWIDDANGFAAVMTTRDDDPTAPGGPVTVTKTGALRFDAKAS